MYSCITIEYYDICLHDLLPHVSIYRINNWVYFYIFYTPAMIMTEAHSINSVRVGVVYFVPITLYYMMGFRN